MKNKNQRPVCVLVDNGSLKPEPTLHLRGLASDLEDELSVPVHPVSLLHSSKVDSSLLGGSAAELLEPVLHKLLGEGNRQIVVLPQFFGPSRALTEYVPARIVQLKEGYPDACILQAGCLFSKKDDSGLLLAGVLRDRILEVSKQNDLKLPRVLMVDHGTPRIEVNHVRCSIVGHLRELMSHTISSVEDCSMERPGGSEYDFNEPLLESLLGKSVPGEPTVVALLFFSGGRHAGKGGDIEGMCKSSGCRVWMTRPIGQHPDIVKILARRFHEVLPPGVSSAS